MSDKKEISVTETEDKIQLDSTKKRRALLASIATAGAASALPTEWKKPVVDSILLPAHGQMSPTDPTLGMVSTTTTVVNVSQTTYGVAACTAQLEQSLVFDTQAPNTTLTSTYLDYVPGTVSGTLISTCSDNAGNTFNQTYGTDSYTTTLVFNVTLGQTVTGATTIQAGSFSETISITLTTNVTQTSTTTVSS